MQSTRPSPRYRNDAGGLPSAPRSRSIVPPTRDAPREYYDDRSPAPALPSSLRQKRPTRSVTHDSALDYGDARPPYEGRSSMSSESSRSSSNSSLLDRMRVRSNESTPRTSIDEEDYKGEIANQDGCNLPEQPSASNQTNGSWLRNAMSGLNINVGKAWSSEVETRDGEATPPGQESRLTRAMKAYHLAKAQNPSDLPEWLFSEQERYPGKVRSSETTAKADRDPAPVAQSPSSRGLHDIYDNAASEPPVRGLRQQPRGGAGRSMSYDEQPMQSRATDRLKAMREARRQGTSITEERDGGNDVRYGRARAEPVSVAREDGRVGRAAGGRYGLPAGPGNGRGF